MLQFDWLKFQGGNAKAANQIAVFYAYRLRTARTFQGGAYRYARYAYRSELDRETVPVGKRSWSTFQGTPGKLNCHTGCLPFGGFR